MKPILPDPDWKVVPSEMPMTPQERMVLEAYNRGDLRIARERARDGDFALNLLAALAAGYREDDK